MVSEIQEATATLAAELWIPEFGVLDTAYLDDKKKYQGRIYNLTAEKCKALAELFGFTASYDNSSIRNAFVDIIKTEGHVTFEIERNTKPTDINLRYARDRWGDAAARDKDPLRPWKTNTYYCKFLPERSFAGLADHLRMKQEHLEHFYIRLNFKDKTAGLIAEDAYVEEFPTGAFQVFALPQDHIAIIPVTEIAAEAAQPAVREVRTQQVDSGPRYATYSQSEIDRMFKLQSESITNAIAGKVSAQQRSFQEAVTAQEKAFNNIAEKFLLQFEEVRSKIESQTKGAQEVARNEMEQFKNQLTKELDQFRAHVNKNILPIPKSIEDKIQQLQAPAKTKNVPQENLKPLLFGLTGVLFVVVAINIALSCINLSGLQELKSQAGQVQQK